MLTSLKWSPVSNYKDEPFGAQLTDAVWDCILEQTCHDVRLDSFSQIHHPIIETKGDDFWAVIDTLIENMRA